MIVSFLLTIKKMAYKKYITRNGKVYGPYYYESKRINGKVVSSYHGVKKSPLAKPTKVSDSKISKEIQIPKKILSYVLPILLVILILAIFLPKLTFTGKAVIGLEGEYFQGEIIKGILDIQLKEGEFLPADTKIIIKNNEKEYEYFLSEITNLQPTTGNYYLEKKDISGNGLGFGNKVKKEMDPSVTLKIISELEETISSNSTSSTVLEPNNSKEIQKEPTIEENKTSTQKPINQSEKQITEEPQEGTITTDPNESTENTQEEITLIEPETSEPTSESKEEVNEKPQEGTSTEETETTPEPTESQGESQPEETQTEPETQLAPITGNAISKIGKGIANFFMSLRPTGNVIESETQINLDYDSPYNYNLKENEEISLIPGSVSTETEKLSDSIISITIENKKATISTNYKIEETGYGKQFLSEETNSIPIDLEELNLELVEGDLEISLTYNEKEIGSAKTKLKENSTFKFEEQPKEITIEETPKELRVIPLSNEDKLTLLEEFGQEKINQNAKEYKNKIIVSFTLREYSIDYSYQKNLDKDLLNFYMERDKINWLKDILYSLEEKSSIEKPLANLTADKELF